MIASSVNKLIDEAIMPAVLLILAKMLGLLLSAYFFNLPFEIQSGGFLKILPSVKFLSIAAYTTAENYSNLAMILVASVGTLIVLVRLHYLHQSHVRPEVQTKLAAVNFEKLISSSYHLYHTAATWLIFLWLTVAFLTVSTIFKITYFPITAIATIVAVNFTWILALDIQKELEVTSG